jgi:hypothetical protein
MVEKTRLPVVTVHETEVLDWYDAGWHFTGADPTRSEWCVMEWRQDRRPVAPFREDAEDKKLLNAVAALEGKAA